MKSKIMVSAVTALCLALSGPVFGQRYDGRGDRGAYQQAQPGGDRQYRSERQYRGERRSYRGYESRNRAYEGRGAGPRQEWHRGARLPNDYRSRQYVVDDWRGHHLHAPPRGYHWVQVGGDYVLAAIATGIILDILLNN